MNGNDGRLDRRADIIAAIGVVGVFFAIFIARNAPLISGDETGFLAVGRYLGGKGVYSMLSQPYYPFGYGALTAPGFFLFDDPHWIYRFAIGVNLVLTGLTVPLGMALLERLGFGRTYLTLACVVIAATWPSHALHISLAWSETLFRTLFLAYLLALVRAVQTGRWTWSVAVSLLVAALYATHGRSLALIPLVLALFVHLALQRKGRVPAAAGVATLIVGIALVAVAHRHFQAVIWLETRPDELVRAAVQRLRSLEGLTAIAFAALGQLWYQLAASFGIVLVGAFVLGRRVLFPEAPGDRVVLLLVFASIGAVAAASVMHMSGHSRIDHLIYGRYLDAATLPLLLVGFVAIARQASCVRPTLILAAFLILIGGIALFIYEDTVDLDQLFDVTVPGVAALQAVVRRVVPNVEMAIFLGVSTVSAVVAVAIGGSPSARLVLVCAALYSLSATYAVNRTLVTAQRGFEILFRQDRALFDQMRVSELFQLKNSWNDWFFFRERFLLPALDVVPVVSAAAVPPGGFLLADRSKTVPGARCLGEVGLLSSLWQKGEDIRIAPWIPGQARPAAQRASWIGCTDGWSAVEPWGRWSDEREATLHVPAGEAPGPLVLQMEVHAFTGAGLPAQRVSVALNGDHLTDWTLTSAKEIKDVPLSAGLNTVTFTFPDARSPAALGLSADERLLGLGVSRLCLAEQGKRCL